MSNSLLLLMAFAAAAQTSATATSAGKMIVSADELAHHTNQYEGKRVFVHACLIKSPHGSFIARCKYKDWHDITLVIPASGRDELLSKTFFDLGGNYSNRLEGDFSGVIVKQHVQWPHEQSQLFLSIDTLEHARLLKP